MNAWTTYLLLRKWLRSFEGLDIQLEQTQPFSVLYTSVREAHGFAQAGGVDGSY